MRALSSSIYARAFRKALKEKGGQEEDCIRHLVSSIKQHGVRGKRDFLFRRIVEELAHHKGGRRVVIETARPLSAAQEKSVRNLFSKNDFLEPDVRPELIAGMRIVADGEREFDGSLKRKLDGLL